MNESDTYTLQIQFRNEVLGVSPIRINNVFETDQIESLRAPKCHQSPLVHRTTAAGNVVAQVAVIDLLNKYESHDIRFMQAE